MVVYHLHGQTGLFMVWVNGSQSSGLINFVPQSRLPSVPLAQISSIYRKTAAKAWNWYQGWLWRNGPRISVWNIPYGKTELPFQMFRFSQNFPSGRHKKSFSIYFPTGFPGKLLGKQPMRTEQSRPWKGIRITESGKILLMESGILGIGIRNATQEIRNPTNDWHPESKFYWQIVKSWPVPGIQNPRLSWIPTYMGREQHWTFDLSYAFLPRDQTRNILQNIVNSENIRMFPFSSSVQS